MRALVAGASGFIGQVLVAELISRGDEIHRLVRGEPGSGEVGIDPRGRRLLTSGLGSEGLESFDAVFNLVGEPITPARWSPAKRERIRASRVTTTDILARAFAATERPPAVFVSASATGYYGGRGDEILDETSTAGEGFLAEVCRAWEAATVPARERGSRVVLIRTGIVLGSSGGMLARLAPMSQHGLGARLGSGQQWMSWISITDAVGAILFLADNATCVGPYNLCAPEPTRNVAFTRALAQAYGRRAHVVVPKALLRAAVGRRTLDEFLLASQRVLPTRLLEAGYVFSEPILGDTLSHTLGAR